MIEYISTGESGFFNIRHDERKKPEERSSQTLTISALRKANKALDAQNVVYGRRAVAVPDGEGVKILYGWVIPR